MKTIILAMAICGMLLCAIPVKAQPPGRPGPPPENGDRPGPPPRGPQGGRGFGGPGGPPTHPLMTALDADGDRTISAEEISAASKALKSLDKNGDGQLTDDELRPEFGMRGRGRNRADRPQRPGGAGEDGAGRRRGQGRGRGEGGRRGPPPGAGPDSGPRGPGGAGVNRRPFDASAFAERILNFDKDDDGLVTSDELPQRMQKMIERGDKNDDGALDREEIEAMAEADDR